MIRHFSGFRWPIKRKLLALGAGTLFPLLLLLAFWAWWEVRHHTEEAEAELILASRQAASQVELLLEQVTRQLRVLADDPAVRHRQAGQMERLFRAFAAGHRDIESVAAFTADGRMIATATPSLAGASVTVADRSWFQRVMTTEQPVVSGFLVGRITGQPIAVVAVPFREGDGPPTGAFATSLRLRRLHVLFESLPLAGRTLTVVDEEGQVLAHAPEAEGWIGRRLPSVTALPAGSAVVTEPARFGEEPWLVAVAPVAGAGWRLLVGVPKAALDATVWKQARAIAIPLLGLLALSGLIGLAIAAQVWRPLRVLADAARRLPEGGRVPVLMDSTDEVGELARAFHAMAAEVAESRASLERRVSELEALSEAGRLLTGTLELSDVLARLTELVQTRLGTDVVRIWLQAGSPGEFRLGAQAGVTRKPGEYRIHLGPGEGLVGWIMERREALVLTDLQGDPRLVNRDWMEAEGLLSFLGVPIVLEDRPIGILACMTRERREFGREEVRLAETFADQAAVALENARLFDEARQALDDLKEAQEQLVRAETLRVVGELASGMAHHLNNILAVIGGRVQLLLQRVEEPSVRRSLEIVERAVANGAEVIRRVQGFTRVRPAVETVPVDLNRLGREVLELTRPRWTDQAQAEGISIEASLEPGEIPAVAGDPGSLTEVLMNLLLNAVEALPSGGRITVRTWASGPWVHCSVSDTGVGMSEEVRLRALEPFFTTKGPKSTGLGLSVAHGTVQRHGGRLEIESTEGERTTVTISLPVALTGPVADPARVPRRTSVGPWRILVIDDEAAVREVLAELLASQGHAVSQAASGAEGVSLFQTDRNDIVFTDFGMPGMNGWQVAGAIKALSPATPVVLVTGWADEIPRPGAQAGSVDQIISKPFRVEALTETLAKLLARSPG